MIGTVRFNLVDGINQPKLKEAIDLVQEQPRGSWCLVAVFDEITNIKDLQKKHDCKQKQLAPAKRKQFKPPKAK